MEKDHTKGNVSNELDRRGMLSRVGAVAGALAFGANTNGANAAATPSDVSVRFKNTGVYVRDLELSLSFYSEVFGFTPDPEPRKIPAALEGYLELENIDLTVHFIEKEGFRIELLHFESPEPFGGERREMNQLGLTHLAFEVSDIDAMTQAVERMGGRVIEKSRFEREGRTRAIFVTDPDGTRIELTSS